MPGGQLNEIFMVHLKRNNTYNRNAIHGHTCIWNLPFDYGKNHYTFDGVEAASQRRPNKTHKIEHNAIILVVCV